MKYGCLTSQSDWTKDEPSPRQFVTPKYLNKRKHRELIAGLQKDLKNPSLIELGCGSGEYAPEILSLLRFPKDGRIEGIDWSQKLGNTFLSSLKSKGYTNCSFCCSDLIQVTTEEITCKYDLVTSGGLVEHFIGDIFEKILELHGKLLSDRGVAIISVPNFHGVRYLWHTLFDFNSFLMHSTDAMIIKNISNYYECKGYEIVETFYHGSFELWRSNSNKTSLPKDLIAQALLKIWNKLFAKLFTTFYSKHPFYFAPYATVIVRNKHQ